jgi:hypothetical protein
MSRGVFVVATVAIRWNSWSATVDRYSARPPPAMFAPTS